jgi:uncharacterized membrane protein
MLRIIKLGLSSILRNFIKGIIIIAPLGITIYTIYFVFTSIESLSPFTELPIGSGVLLILSLITIVGFLGTRLFIVRFLIQSFEYLIEKTPGVRFLYSGVKDVVNSFVGDKKKFNKAVWVKTNDQPEIWRIGFLTQDDMSQFGMTDYVAVYLPHAYAISGWVVITPAQNVKIATKFSSAEAMKFAVSGGMTISDTPKTNKS